MRRLLWLAAWSGVAVWSLVALAAYGLLDFFGGLAMRNADLFSSNPEAVETIFRVFSFLHSASTSVALVVWGGVSLLILSVPWLLDRFAGKARVQVFRTGMAPARPGWRPATPATPDGVIDLAPDQYSVRPRSGSVPTIGLRD